MSKKALLLPLAGALFVACSGTAGQLGAGDTAAGEHPLPPPVYTGFRGHLMPPVGASTRAAAPETGTLSYFGGKVVSATKLYAIYWANGGSYKAKLDPFLQAITDDGFLGWLGEYDTSTQRIGGGAWKGSIIDTSAPAGTSVDDAKIQAELVNLINAGKVPAPDADTLYMFFFPQGVNITLSGQGASCSAFCGYHDTLVAGSTEAYYAVLPDPATCGSACDTQSGNYFNDLTSVTTHELTEAITDPEVGVAIAGAADGGAYPRFPNAWAASSGGSEIGDLCAWQDATYRGYNVQLEWSDHANACVLPSGGATDGGTGGGDSGSDGGLPDAGPDGGFVAPTCDGVIAPGEYGGPQNQATGDTAQTWYMTWDGTNLYVAIDNAATSEGNVLYVGTGSGGITSGQLYDNTNVTLPAPANLVVYAKKGYTEARLASGGGWGPPDQTHVRICAGASGGTREEVIPWSLLGGAPASFGWVGYLAGDPAGNASGYIYGQMPVDNPRGAGAGHEVDTRYFLVPSTASGASFPFADEQ